MNSRERETTGSTGLHLSGDVPDLEAEFLHDVHTHLFPVSITEAWIPLFIGSAEHKPRSISS